MPSGFAELVVDEVFTLLVRDAAPFRHSLETGVGAAFSFGGIKIIKRVVVGQSH
jgi:hypothetical protein